VLTELDLSFNGIDDAGALALASALRVNGVLKSINLEYTNLGDEGKQGSDSGCGERAGRVRAQDVEFCESGRCRGTCMN